MVSVVEIFISLDRKKIRSVVQRQTELELVYRSLNNIYFIYYVNSNTLVIFAFCVIHVTKYTLDSQNVSISFAFNPTT